MKSHRTFRIDKIFGLATLISIMAMAIMIYNDYFKGTVDISGIFGKDSQEETRTSEYLNDKSTEQTTEPENDRIVICLDAAKGGSESGLMSGSKKEKDITLDMAVAVKTKLETRGIKVVMTRESDKDVSEETRTKICNESGAFACVSLRMNSYNADTSVSGAESYIHTTQPSQAAELSRNILSNMEKTAGIRNRGVKVGTVSDTKDNYYINAHSKCNSCIINMGFITNASDLKRVTTEKDKTAQAIADGILDYLRQAGLY